MTIPISSFHPTQKHSSWIEVPVNEWPNVGWKAPIIYPGDPDNSINAKYVWDEDLYQSDNTKGWITVE